MLKINVLASDLSVISNGSFVLVDSNKGAYQAGYNIPGQGKTLNQALVDYEKDSRAYGIGLLFGDDYVGFDIDSYSQEQILEIALKHGLEDGLDLFPSTFTVSSYNREFAANKANPAYDSAGRLFANKKCLIFKVPKNLKANLYFVKYPGGEIRYKSQNGNYCYSVVTGSHPTTGHYEILDNTEPATLPDWLLNYWIYLLASTTEDVEFSKSDYIENDKDVLRKTKIEKILFESGDFLKVIGYEPNTTTAKNEPGQCKYSVSRNRWECYPKYRESSTGESIHFKYDDCLYFVDRSTGIGGGLPQFIAYEKSSYEFNIANKEDREKCWNKMAILANCDVEWGLIQNQQFNYSNDEIEENLEYFNRHNIPAPALTAILPENLARELNIAAKEFYIPPIVILATMLTYAASLQKTQTCITIKPGYNEPPILFTTVVAASGTGKTPILNKFRSAIQKLQNKHYEKFKEADKQWRIDLAKWKCKSKEAEKNSEPFTKEEPPRPKFRHFTFKDYTVEALVCGLIDHPEYGSIIDLDEIKDLLVDHYGKNTGGTRIREILKEFWSAGEIKIARKHDQPLFLNKSSLSVIGGLQPSILEAKINADKLSTDGFLQRMIYAVCPCPPEIEDSERPDTLTPIIERLFEKLEDMDAQQHTLTKSIAGIETKKEWKSYTEKFRLSYSHNETIAALSSKYNAYGYRLALVLHRVKAAYLGETPAAEIDVQTLKDGISIAKYFLAEAVKIFSQLEDDNHLAKKFNKVLNKFSGQTVTESAVRKLIYTNGTTAEKTKNTLELLELMVKKGLAAQISDKNKNQWKINYLTTFDSENRSSKGFEDVVTHNYKITTNHKITTNPPVNEPITDLHTITPTTVEIQNKIVAKADNSSIELFEDLPILETRKYDPRHYIIKSEGRIDVDYTKLDLDYQPATTYPSWQPTRELIPWDNVPKMVLDIETVSLTDNPNDALDPDKSRVVAVGILYEGKSNIFINQDEAALLTEVIAFLKKHKNIDNPVILLGHNIFEFDLPFLAKRAHQLNLKWWNKDNEKSALWINNQENFKGTANKSKITGASFHGAAIEFWSIKLDGYSIVDTMQQCAIWDKSANKLQSYSLKNSVITLGLREERRLELSAADIKKSFDSSSPELAEYLEYDLIDTKLLADYLLPPVYYQMQLLPKNEHWSFQRVAIASVATKVEAIHESLLTTGNILHIEGKDIPLKNGIVPHNSAPSGIADPKIEYDGGAVRMHNPGIHRNVFKVDVASLYPSLMLRYALGSRKDPQNKYLAVLAFIKKERIRLKALARAGDKNANHAQNALKIILNGSYGFLGTKYCLFNDMEAAALITAYGRKVLELLETTIVDCGAILIESDTDGVIASGTNAQAITDKINQVLPEGLSVELEYENCIGWIPKGKNYIILPPDSKPIIKGFKRNDIPLINEFKLEYMKRYASDPTSAQSYYLEVVEQIKNGAIDVAKLTVFKKIPTSDKRLTAAGLGAIGEKIYYYESGRGKGDKHRIPTKTEPYNIEFYLDKIQKVYNELTLKTYENIKLEGEFNIDITHKEKPETDIDLSFLVKNPNQQLTLEI